MAKYTLREEAKATLKSEMIENLKSWIPQEVVDAQHTTYDKVLADYMKLNMHHRPVKANNPEDEPKIQRLKELCIQYENLLINKRG